MTKRIGLLGGTFDPVHIGHLRSALEVADALALDELRLLPNFRPPHRDTPQVAAEQRLEMVRVAVEGISPLVVDDRELKRDKPSYTIDTLELMRAELAADDPLFLLFLGFAKHAHQLLTGKTVVAGQLTDKFGNLGRAIVVTGLRLLRCTQQPDQAHPGRMPSRPAAHYLH